MCDCGHVMCVWLRSYVWLWSCDVCMTQKLFVIVVMWCVYDSEVMCECGHVMCVWLRHCLCHKVFLHNSGVVCICGHQMRISVCVAMVCVWCVHDCFGIWNVIRAKIIATSSVETPQHHKTKRCALHCSCVLRVLTYRISIYTYLTTACAARNFWSYRISDVCHSNFA